MKVGFAFVGISSGVKKKGGCCWKRVSVTEVRGVRQPEDKIVGEIATFNRLFRDVWFGNMKF